MLLEICLITLTIYLCSLYMSRRKLSMSNKLKSDLKSYPVIGHALYFIGDDEDRMDGIKVIGRDSIRNGGVSPVDMFPYFYVGIADAATAELVLKTCLEKDSLMRFIRFITGNGTIFAPVKIWRPRRKILVPVFSPKALTSFMEVFIKQSSVLVNELEKTSDKGPFSIWEYMTTYAMDSVCETNLGIEVHAQLNRDQPFLKAFKETCEIIGQRLVQPWLYFDCVFRISPQYPKLKRCRDVLLNFVNKVIKDKRISIIKENKQSERVTFLDMLIESSGGLSKGFTDLELQEETLVIAMAGTDTSAVGASFITILLGQYPEIQEKVYSELHEVFPDRTKVITNEDLPRLKYFDAVIKEALRMYPPVPCIARKAHRDFTLPCGVTVLKGTGLLINIWAIHRNPTYWGPDADIFRPERFLEGPLKHPAAFIPFSTGPRNCLGYQYAMMSMKTVVASLLLKYRIKAAPETDLHESYCNRSPQTELRVKYDIMMKHVDNYVIQLEKRK